MAPVDGAAGPRLRAGARSPTASTLSHSLVVGRPAKLDVEQGISTRVLRVVAEVWSVEPASGQTMWRLLGAQKPKLRDFESNRDKGRTRGRRQPYIAHLGLSMFDSLDLAVRNARIFPAYVAAVELASGRGFSVARTVADTKGHHTVWGEPAELWGHVVAVDTATTVY